MYTRVRWKALRAGSMYTGRMGTPVRMAIMAAPVLPSPISAWRVPSGKMRSFSCPFKAFRADFTAPTSDLPRFTQITKPSQSSSFPTTG